MTLSVLDPSTLFLSRTKKVDLTFFSIFFSYLFSFDLFSFILFLELGLGLEWQDHAVTQHVTSDDTGHKSHNTEKDVKGSGRMMLYNM